MAISLLKSAGRSTDYRQPPQNVEAEQCVLGGILIEDGALLKVVDILNPRDFYREIHGIIYGAMLELLERNEPQDLVTVNNLLKSKGRLETIGGVSYLAELTEVVPVASNIGYYARIVRDKSILRRLIQASSDIAALCYEEADAVDEIIQSAESVIFEISQERIRQAFYPLNGVLKDSIKKVEIFYENKKLITGVSSGFYELDQLTAGFQPSDLVIIAGRPSMGKTALALNIAQRASIENNTTVAIFSLEMSKEQLALRMLCSEARVDAQKVRTGFLSEHDWPVLINAAGRLSEASIFIDDTPAASVLEMRAKARRLKSEHGLGLVIVDYLQLMRGRAQSERREQEISDISRSLKAMAKELNVPVIALSQLNRKVEDRPNKRPQMADLRESGAIEQDADVIIFIYRDEVYSRPDEDNPNRGKAELNVAKQRNGPTGLVQLAFVSKFSTFANLSRETEG
ncbi:MAG: replicative DNA helicase [Desulfobacteraceae bacterium]|nr:replicative DNA helicase [Desulfobacteraceae bacterium]